MTWAHDLLTGPRAQGQDAPDFLAIVATMREPEPYGRIQQAWYHCVVRAEGRDRGVLYVGTPPCISSYPAYLHRLQALGHRSHEAGLLGSLVQARGGLGSSRAGSTAGLGTGAGHRGLGGGGSNDRSHGGNDGQLQRRMWPFVAVTISMAAAEPAACACRVQARSRCVVRY